MKFANLSYAEQELIITEAMAVIEDGKRNLLKLTGIEYAITQHLDSLNLAFSRLPYTYRDEASDFIHALRVICNYAFPNTRDVPHGLASLWHAEIPDDSIIPPMPAEVYEVNEEYRSKVRRVIRRSLLDSASKQKLLDPDYITAGSEMDASDIESTVDFDNDE